MTMIMSTSKKYAKIRDLLESICRTGGWADCFRQNNGRWALRFDGTREEYRRLLFEIKRRAEADLAVCQKIEELKADEAEFMAKIVA